MTGWQRRGRVLAPGGPEWARTHAALPTVDTDPDGRSWLYCSPRDAEGRAHVARAAVTWSGGGLEVAALEPEPVLSPGILGTFDDSGVTVSCVVADGDRRILYYSGWTRGRTVPFYFYVGAAESDDGGRSFERVSLAPVLERNDVDPYLTASPCVLRDGNGWRMWYVSCSGWTTVEGEPRHHYLIKHAESDDGLRWRRNGHVAVGFADPDEYAISRPCVVGDADGGYSMWFSSRGTSYRLQAATSSDGLTWNREPAIADLTPATDGWDSEMIAYPWVVDRGSERLMLYNGNGYGATGIGLAVAPTPVS